MARSEDLIMMTPAQLRALTNKELRAVTQQLADAANKRIKRLLADETGVTSPILTRGKGGEIPYYSVKGKTTRGEIMSEYKRIKNVMRPGAKTSSVKAWKQEVKKIETRVGGRMTPEMWRAYRQLESIYGGQFPGSYGSDEIQRMLVQAGKAGMSMEEMIEKTSLELTKAYENGSFDDEDFYELDEFEEEFSGPNLVPVERKESGKVSGKGNSSKSKTRKNSKKK